jgi:hypothetical protein
MLAVTRALQLSRPGQQPRIHKAQNTPVGLDGRPVVDISLSNRNAVEKYFRQQLRGGNS